MTPDLNEIFHASVVQATIGFLYGDWIIGTEDHANLWESLFKEGELKMLPPRYQVDYTLLPRGRVSYNLKSERFFVYHGNWLRSKHRSLILKRFNLQRSRTSFEEDEHYRK
jgi:hypothetical protein